METIIAFLGITTLGSFASFNFLASLINGNRKFLHAHSVEPFNFLASLINGNIETFTIAVYVILAFNFLASLINGNLERARKTGLKMVFLLTS